MSAIIPGIVPSILQDVSKGILTYTAGSSISGSRGIKIVNDVPAYCDASVAGDIGKLVGISLNAATSGNPLNVQYDGIFTDSGWSWAEGPVYLDATGQLTQTVTGLAFVQNIGEATSPTTININIKTPTKRA